MSSGAGEEGDGGSVGGVWPLWGREAERLKIKNQRGVGGWPDGGLEKR